MTLTNALGNVCYDALASCRNQYLEMRNIQNISLMEYLTILSMRASNLLLLPIENWNFHIAVCQRDRLIN